MQFGHLIIHEDEITFRVTRRAELVDHFPSGTLAILCTIRDANQHLATELTRWKDLYQKDGHMALPQSFREVFKEYFEFKKLSDKQVQRVTAFKKYAKNPGGKAGMPAGINLFEIKKDDPNWQLVKCEHCYREMRKGIYDKRHGDLCKFKGMKHNSTILAKDGRRMKMYTCLHCGVLIKGPSIGPHQAACGLKVSNQ